ncbi:hypothetical protein BVRB_015160 isoform B, partial [Beta vulgaris subsp. vulgaris]
AFRRKDGRLLLFSSSPPPPIDEAGRLLGGLQLAQGGNRIVFEEFLKKLEVGASIKELCIDLPIFSDINSKDPLKAFNN